jgi:ubiquinone/menaquinone biosynthesis C-methylase UbiE
MIRPGTMLRWHALARLLRSIVKDGMTVLDIGGYDGYIAFRIREIRQRSKIIVVDTDMPGLVKAHARLASAVCSSALALPFPDSTIDVVLCLDLIEHVKEDEMLVREIGRVLKKNGTLILTTPHEKGISFPGLGEEEMCRMQKEWGHVRLGYSMDNLRWILGENGIAVAAEGRYFNLFSRLAYRTLMFYGSPSPSSRRMFRLIAALERVTAGGAQEHIVVGRKHDG